MLDEFVRRHGFESEREFHKLVAASDLSTPAKEAAFRHWQYEDGSKAGLLKLHETHGTAAPPKLASADRIDEILTTQFGVDIRKTKVGAAEFAVTFDEGRPAVVCVWGDLPPGHSVNGQTTWWIRLWEEGDPLPDELTKVIEAVQ